MVSVEGLGVFDMIQLSQAACDPIKCQKWQILVGSLSSEYIRDCVKTGNTVFRLEDNNSDLQDYGIEDFCE